MDGEVYKINENGERVDDFPNWKGWFHPDSTEDSLWMYIVDKNRNKIQIEQGTRIRYCSDCTSQDYIIKDARTPGIYNVQRL